MGIYSVSGTSLSACYDLEANDLNHAYDLDGDVIFTKAPPTTDYASYTATSYRNITVSYTQGMEIYDDVLFQFRGPNNLVSVFNFATGATITAEMSIESGHSNAVAFSKTFYAQSDDFPIIYCGDWNNSVVHVLRISTDSSSKLYDITFSGAGYHPNPAIDFDNGIMYTVGYYLNDTTASAGNYCIVCKWDLTNMTDNGDGTFTPTLLDTYTRDYIYVMQDLKYNDGLIWICSGYGSSTQYVYGMNPETGVFTHTITMPIKTEIEGLVWMLDSDTGLYYAYVGFQGGKYYKVVFAAQT